MPTVKESTEKVKLRNKPSKSSDGVDESSKEAYRVDIDIASKSDSVLKIDSPEQANQIIAEVRREIGRDPTGAALAHSHLDATRDSGYWLNLLGIDKDSLSGESDIG